jgi:tetratricopeptide (TPR) repeat protein
LELGDEEELELGDRLFAIGNPLGLQGSVSDGILSAVRERDDGVRWLQITAPISPGSSGGPVVNERGEVVGVSTASFTKGQNLNVAIPVGSLKTLMSGDSLNEPFAPENLPIRLGLPSSKPPVRPGTEQSPSGKGTKAGSGIARAKAAEAKEALEGGDYAGAKILYQEALAALLAQPDAPAADLAAIYNCLGVVANALGFPDEAIANLEKSLAIRKLLGAKPEIVASVHFNLGVAHYNAGDYQMALERFEKVLEIRLQTLGKDHPLVAEVHGLLGCVYAASGEPDRAKEHFNKALEILEDSDGNEGLSAKIEAALKYAQDEGDAPVSLGQNEQPPSHAQNEVPEKDAAGDPNFVIVTTNKAKIHKEADKGSDLVANAKWMTPYVVIKRERDAGRWMIRVGEFVSNTEAKPIGWIRQVDLLTDDRAIKSEGIYVKAFPVTRFDAENDKVEGAKLRNAPGEGGDVIGQEMTQFGIYFVFAENEDLKSGNTYYLMGSEPEIFDNQKPEDSILGWVCDRRMHRWDTRQAAEYDKSTLAERGPVKIYATEADMIAVLKGATNVEPLFIEDANKTKVGYAEPRYPIIGPEREVNGHKYWNVAFVPEQEGARGAASGELARLFQMQPAVDILIVIDGTGSMSEFKDPVIAAVRSIQNAAINYWRDHFKEEQEPKLRFSLTLFKDYSENDFYRRTPLEKGNMDEIADLLQSHDWSGGMSSPAVFHGLSSSIKDAAPDMDPAAFRAVFLIGDMGNLGVSDDDDKNGHSTDSVIRVLKTNNLDFHAIHVATEYMSNPNVPQPIKNAIVKFKTQTETIKDALAQGMSSYTALSDPNKVTDQIQEAVTDILDQRYRTIQEIIAVKTTGKAIGNTLIGQRAIQLMKQNGIDPSEFAQKKISPFFEGWVAPIDPVSGKRQMKEVILLEKREAETLISVLGRMGPIKRTTVQTRWIQVLSNVAGDDIKIGVNDSPAELYRIWMGLPIKSGILSKSFDEIGNLPVAEKAEAIKGFQKKLFLLRGVVGEKEIERMEDPKTGRTSYKVKGDKQYWFGHRGSFHAWLDREVYIP